MSINLDALLALPECKVNPCLIGRIVEDLPEPYKGALIALLDDPTVTSAFVTERIAAAGLCGSHATVHRHRKNRCSCNAGGAA